MPRGASGIKRLRRYVSILDGIQPYRSAWLPKDIIAGITLAALAIPETMGYTKIAGMPVITGLYTILVPIAAFAVFGSSKHLVVGADSATAAIMSAGIAALGIAGLQPGSPQWVGLAGMSALLAGGLLLLARVARLGFLANFLSRTVLIGFLTDLVGLGLANLAAGFTGTFVVNGSPTKTEMVDESKSHTQIAQLTTAAVVAIVLIFLTKPLQYLPDCVLSSVVFLIGLKLIDVDGMREIYRVRRDEFYVALLTAIVVIVVGVEEGIILAIVLSLILHVHRHYETVDVIIAPNAEGHLKGVPPAPATRTEPGLVIYRFGAGIFYANATRLSDEVLAIAESDDPPRWIVLDAAAVDDIDYTGGKMLVELADELSARKIVLGFSELNDRVFAQLAPFGITPKVASAHIFDTIQDAIDAFRRAE